MEGGRGTGGDCGGETESRQAAHGEHAGWRIVQCAANLTPCKIDSREAKGNPAPWRGAGTPRRGFPTVPRRYAMAAISRHDSAQRRQASAHRCIISSPPPRRSQDLAHRSQASAHTPHTAG